MLCARATTCGCTCGCLCRACSCSRCGGGCGWPCCSRCRDQPKFQRICNCSSTSRMLENTFCHSEPNIPHQWTVLCWRTISINCSMVKLTFETKLSTAGANEDSSLLTPVTRPHHPTANNRVCSFRANSWKHPPWERESVLGHLPHFLLIACAQENPNDNGLVSLHNVEVVVIAGDKSYGHGYVPKGRFLHHLCTWSLAMQARSIPQVKRYHWNGNLHLCHLSLPCNPANLLLTSGHLRSGPNVTHQHRQFWRKPVPRPACCPHDMPNEETSLMIPIGQQQFHLERRLLRKIHVPYHWDRAGEACADSDAGCSASPRQLSNWTCQPLSEFSWRWARSPSRSRLRCRSLDSSTLGQCNLPMHRCLHLHIRELATQHGIPTFLQCWSSWEP